MSDRFKLGDIVMVNTDEPPGNPHWPRPPKGTRAEFVRYGGGGHGRNYCWLRWIDQGNWSGTEYGWSVSRLSLARGPW